MNNLVKTVMLLRNLEDYPRMRKTELEYYQKHAPLLVDEPPASTFIQPISLATSKFLVEIDAIGFIPM
jgi:enamine deaminase RidA (YjgF/YER057c/UK114 family)